MTRGLLSLLGAIIVIGLAMTALASRDSWGPSPMLRAIRQDPMARDIPPGTRPAETYEDDESSFIGRSSPASVLRVFTVRRVHAAAALEAASQAARRAGWRRDQLWSPPDRPDPEYAAFVRSGPEGQDIGLSITSGPPEPTASTESTREQAASLWRLTVRINGR